jgi:hypothetical protein
MRLWVRRRWSRRSIAADYSMPRPFGKPCAAALDGIVPQPPQRQEAARLKPASQQPHEFFKQFLAAIRRQPADGGHIDPRDGQANHADVDPVSQRPFWNQPGQQQRGNISQRTGDQGWRKDVSKIPNPPESRNLINYFKLWITQISFMSFRGSRSPRRSPASVGRRSGGISRCHDDRIISNKTTGL